MLLNNHLEEKAREELIKASEKEEEKNIIENKVDIEDHSENKTDQFSSSEKKHNEKKKETIKQKYSK